MTAPTCIVCGSPVADGAYLDNRCTDRARGQLAEIGRLVEDARAVAYGLSSRHGSSGGSRKPGSRSPGNDDALDALDAVTNALTTIAREIADTRGSQIAVDGPGHPDPLGRVCSWLQGNLEWLRHAVDDQGGPYAAGVLDEIEACVRRMRGIVEGPRPKRYLGPCLAPTMEDHSVFDGEREWAMFEEGPPCEGDVYGTVGGEKGTCRTCGATVKQGERRAWLDDQVRDKAFRLAHIADAYRLNLKTLRDWATDRPEVRAENGVVIRSAKAAKLRVHGTDRQGKQLFLVGDVLGLAKAAALKRAENEARRDRGQETAA